MTGNLLLLSILVLLTVVNGGCIDNKGENKCKKSSSATDCDAGSQCMEIFKGQSGNSAFYCGVPQEEGCDCDPSLLAAEACASGMSCKQTKCSNNGCKYECSPFSEDELRLQCKNEDTNLWTLIFDHDQMGIPISGSKTTLIDYIHAGAEVKVMTNFGLFNVHKLSNGTLENVNAMCGQALFWMPYSPGSNSYNVYVIAATTGNIHLTSLRPGEPESDTNNPLPYLNSNVQRPIKWFVRSASTEVSAQSEVLDVIHSGASIRIGLHTEINDTYRPIETTSYNPDDQSFVGTAIWEMRDHLAGREFLTQEQWLYSQWFSDDSIQGSSWVLHTHDKTSDLYKSSQDVTWYADTCWQFVYRHDNEGKPVSGNLDDFIAAAKQGKRVKVQINNVFHEANKVEIFVDETSVKDSYVTIQVYDSLCDDLSDAAWCWLILSTDGTVTTIRTPVGQSNPQSTPTTSDMVWFVEQRTWALAASLDASGVASEGSLTNLLDAYDGGADFRYCFTRSDITECLQADHMTRRGNLLIAYHDRELQVEDPDVFRRYTFTFTIGRLMAKTYTAEGQFVRDEQMETLAVKWFTSGFQAP